MHQTILTEEKMKIRGANF